MPHLVEELTKKGLLHPPQWLPDNLVYLTIMGSTAYGCAMPDSGSDWDMYGICVPPKRIVFPHTEGHIPHFGRKLHPENFEQMQVHGVVDPDAHGGKGQEYDFDLKNIVHYFQLCMDNNPNMLDSIFTPQHCVLYVSPIGQRIRDARKMFLHKGCYHRFRGYAFSQLHKMKNKEKDSPKRQASIDKWGYDVKFAYHVVRLMLQCEQMLIEGDMDLMRNAEVLKSIRRGEWTENQIREFFAKKEVYLEELYQTSTALPHSPDEKAIRALLLSCLEQHYGSLKDCIVSIERYQQALIRIRGILEGENL